MGKGHARWLVRSSLWRRRRDGASVMRVLMGVYLPSDEIRIVLSAARLDRILASAPRFCSEDGTLSSPS